MKNGSAFIGLAACAGFAMATIAAFTTASAQSTLYPAGTDCTGLVGNSKTECANQAKNSASPDNSNNPSMNSTDSQSYANAEASNYRSGTGMGVDPNNHENYRNYPGAGTDCAEMVGNTKGDCAARATHGPSNDDSNNPDQMN